MPRLLTQVGILDEHGPALVLPSYSQECIADWIKNDADLLRNAVKMFSHSSAIAASGGKGTEGIAGVLSGKGFIGRLDATNFLPAGHGGKDMTLSFNFLLPPPYRVVMLIALGLLCFGSNLDILHRIGLDPELLPNFSSKSASKRRSLTGLPSHARQQSQASSSAAAESSTTSTGQSTGTATYARSQAVYGLGVLYGTLAVLGWFLFRCWVDGPIQGDPFGNHAQAYQGVTFFSAIIIALWPGALLFRSTRMTFLKSLLRISWPSFRQRISFGDVILADILTSFAKVFGDVWLSICFLWPRTEHHTWWNGKGSIVVPVMTSVPYLIRLRQCLSEYFTSEPAISLTAGKGRRSRKPLANALKYASALPVIWLSTLHEMVENTTDLEIDARMRLPEQLADGWGAYRGWIFQLWLLSVFINSLFSFWWDVTNDWGLDLLRFSTWSKAAPSLAQGVPYPSLHKRGMSTLQFTPPTPKAAKEFLASSYRRLSWQSVSSGLNGLTELKVGGRNDGTREEGSMRAREKRVNVHEGSDDEGGPSVPKESEKSAEKEDSVAIDMSAGSSSREKGTQPAEKSADQHQRAISLLSPDDVSLRRSGSGSGSERGNRPHHHRRNTSLLLLRSDTETSTGVGMLLFHPAAYQVVVILDLILRFLWSLKLSSHLHHVVELEAGVFAIEALEIVRRWAWTFLRVEWEFVKQRRVASVAATGASSTATFAAVNRAETSAGPHRIPGK